MDFITLKRACPLCGSTKARLHGDLHFVLFDGSPISGNCSLVSCAECGFAFYDTSSTQSNFDQYYLENSYYFTTTSTGSGSDKPEDVKRFEGVAARLSPYIKSKDAAIFDIGCAKGGMLTVLAKLGFSNLYGADMLPDCTRHLKATLDVSVETGSALDIPFPDVAADVLIYSHVVEHVIDLKTLAAKAKEKLDDNGILYVEVPDASRYGEFSSYPYQDLYLEHVNHFDMKTLTAFFHANGFKTLSSGTYKLKTAANGSVPCIWLILSEGKTTQKISCHPNLGNNLQLYMDRSATHPILTTLSKLTTDNRPLYIWGISQYAMLLIGQTGLKNGNLKGFVDKDSSKQKRTLLGRQISAPDILMNATNDDVLFVAAIGYEKEIIHNLKSIGFKGRVTTTENLEEAFKD